MYPCSASSDDDADAPSAADAHRLHRGAAACGGRRSGGRLGRRGGRQREGGPRALHPPLHQVDQVAEGGAAGGVHLPLSVAGLYAPSSPLFRALQSQQRPESSKGASTSDSSDQVRGGAGRGRASDTFRLYQRPRGCSCMCLWPEPLPPGRALTSPPPPQADLCWELVARTRKHARYAQMYGLPSYNKGWAWVRWMTGG